MANDEHVAMLKQGVAAWNAWRDETPNIRPDLSGADLSETNLSGANLREAHLTRANLSGAHLSKADLREANLTQANLMRANLTGTSLGGSSLGGVAVGGGGILVREGGSLTLLDTTVSNNQAPVGGGIAAHGPVTINRSAIYLNTANMPASYQPFGGGLLVENADATITNTTFSGNAASGNGGGVMLSATGGAAPTFVLNNVTIAYSQGSGLYVQGVTATTKNTLLANNSASTGPNCRVAGGSLVSGGNNLIGNIAGCVLTGQQASDLVGTASAPIDPKLGPLSGSIGPTQTHPLLAGSPAIDAGNNATCRTYDQRSVARPQGTRCDIGAYEKEVATMAFVVEYFNRMTKRYVTTASRAEIDAIERGERGDWVRTGNDFVSGGAVPVCRLRGARQRGSDARFLSADPDECAQALADPAWQLDTYDFHATPAVAGDCSAGMAPVYRAFNAPAGANEGNHRYTTDTSLYANLVAAGWTGEGVVFCAFE